MQLVKRLEPLALLLVIVGAINWLCIGAFDYNFVSKVLGGGTASDVFYVVLGVAALTFLPRLMEELHIGGRHAPHGA